MTTIAITILSLIGDPAFSRSGNSARAFTQTSTLEEATRAGNKAIAESAWAKAETYFREAVKLAPAQGFWRIQLVLVLGQQKKWKAAFAEMEPLLRKGAFDWLLSMNKNFPNGKVAFVNTELFRDEEHGISRYVQAVKEKGKVASVSYDIGVKLDDFAKQHKIALIYDVGEG